MTDRRLKWPSEMNEAHKSDAREHSLTPARPLDQDKYVVERIIEHDVLARNTIYRSGRYRRNFANDIAETVKNKSSHIISGSSQTRKQQNRIKARSPIIKKGGWKKTSSVLKRKIKKILVEEISGNANCHLFSQKFQRLLRISSKLVPHIVRNEANNQALLRRVQKEEKPSFAFNQRMSTITRNYQHDCRHVLVILMKIHTSTLTNQHM